MIEINLKNKEHTPKISGTIVEISAEVSFLLHCIYGKILDQGAMLSVHAKKYLQSILDRTFAEIEQFDAQEKARRP